MNYQNVLEDMNRQVAEGERARQRVEEAIRDIERLQSEHQQAIREVELMEYDREWVNREMHEIALMIAEHEQIEAEGERARQRVEEAIRDIERLQSEHQQARQRVELMEYDHKSIRQAMRETARMLSEQEQVARVVGLMESEHQQARQRVEQAMQDMRETARMFSALIEMEVRSHQVQAPLRLEKDIEQPERTIVIPGEETLKEQMDLPHEPLRQCFSDEELTELLSLDESQWIEVIKSAQQKNWDSKIGITRGRVVDAAWTLTPSVFFELIKFLLSDGDQQLIYLMEKIKEKIKDLPVEAISKVLEEIRKKIDSFLL